MSGSDELNAAFEAGLRDHAGDARRDRHRRRRREHARGAIRPNPAANEFVAVGETVNRAARLQAAAPVGGVLISTDTHQHVRGAFGFARR